MDSEPAAKLVKFVTAIERMLLISDEKVDISSKVIERGAALIFDSDSRDLDYWRKEIDRIYDCRSKLVHGAMSPYDPKVFEMYIEASEICQYVLMCGVDFFGHLGMRCEKVANKKLRAAFSALVENANSLNLGGTSARIEPL